VAERPDDRPQAQILELINALVRERQRLRAARESDDVLEANRLGIVYWQQQLARRALAARRGTSGTALSRNL
jgi:hypothetical protein